MPQEKIIKILDKEDMQYINLTKDFCNNSNSEKLYLNFDPVHLSKKGHDLVFNILREKVE